MSENNMAEPENNMAEPDVNMQDDLKMDVYSNTHLSWCITLPLGSSFSIETDAFGEQKVMLGILGELEKQIFELKDRFSKIEDASNKEV